MLCPCTAWAKHLPPPPQSLCLFPCLSNLFLCVPGGQSEASSTDMMQGPATGEPGLFWKPNERAAAACVLLDSTQVPINIPLQGILGKHRHPAPPSRHAHSHPDSALTPQKQII